MWIVKTVNHRLRKVLGADLDRAGVLFFIAAVSALDHEKCDRAVMRMIHSCRTSYSPVQVNQT